jgi:aminopeptidase-like protein
MQGAPDNTALDGDGMHALMGELFPIGRSITGQGVRETLSRLVQHVPLKVHEVESGTQCFDWVVPDEWNVSEAWIADENGQRVVDFADSNLHLVSYSVPIDAVMSLEELRPHLHTLPSQPNAIPYRTSYYKQDWGFCLSEHTARQLKDGRYHVKIDAKLAPGSLTYGELLIPGDNDQEILLSTNICHPSMANNELSGTVLTTALARWLLDRPQRRYSYRILWLPETIGAIVYLSRHAKVMKAKTLAGYQIVCVGGPNNSTYLETPCANRLTDRITKRILAQSRKPYQVLPFARRGSDERQYCSPGIGLPVGSLMRSKYREYPEYHTSLDNLDFVTAGHLDASLELYQACLEAIERRRVFVSTVNGGEPNLGRRDLYPSVGGSNHTQLNVQGFLAVMAFANGEYDLEDIAELNELPLDVIEKSVDTLVEKGLLKERR